MHTGFLRSASQSSLPHEYERVCHDPCLVSKRLVEKSKSTGTLAAIFDQSLGCLQALLHGLQQHQWPHITCGRGFWPGHCSGAQSRSPSPEKEELKMGCRRDRQSPPATPVAQTCETTALWQGARPHTVHRCVTHESHT